MIVKKYNNIQDVKNDWLKFQAENESIDPMCHYAFVEKFKSGITNKIKNIVKKNSAPVYYEVYDDDKPVLIFPAEEIAGQIESLYTLDFFDIITGKDITENQVYDALKAISDQEKKKVVVKRFRENFNTHSKLAKLAEIEPYNNCVKIDYTEDYDKYYSSLSKHARQNLRTAYNRLATDGKKYEFSFHFGKLNSKNASKLKDIYLNRRASKYNNMNFLKKLVYKIDEPISNVCFGLENSFTSIVSINGKPVAFMAGIISHGEALVPRLAIDDKFARYSTGVILVNETIKELINRNIYCLNLATGTETYKTQMGGTEYSVMKLELGGGYHINNKN